jgi:hypothetical protein
MNIDMDIRSPIIVFSTDKELKKHVVYHMLLLFVGFLPIEKISALLSMTWSESLRQASWRGIDLCAEE